MRTLTRKETAVTAQDTHRSANIKGCNEETIYDFDHYYDCRPYQNDRYTFTVRLTGESETHEAMHALMPVFHLLPHMRGDDALWHMEEMVHALLHGDTETAVRLGYRLGLRIHRA